MVASIAFHLLSTIFLVSFTTLVHSQELQPIRAGPGGYVNSLNERALQLSNLDLLNDATFLWNDPSTGTHLSWEKPNVAIESFTQ